MKELGRTIMIKFVGLRANANSYLIDEGSEVKKAKGTKRCVIKGKINFENYKNSLEETQIEKKNYLEKKFDIDSIKKTSKEFIKTINKHSKYLKLKSISLSSNNYKWMQSIDSIETYGYGTSIDLVSEKEGIKYNNIIKCYKKWLTLLMLQKKT